MLDIWGEERTTGKTLGTDLEKQKLTLPLIRLLATAAPATADRVRGLLAEARPDAPPAPPPRPRVSGALEYAWERARQHAAQALAALDVLADSHAKVHPPLPRPLRRPPRLLNATDLKAPGICVVLYQREILALSGSRPSAPVRCARFRA